MGFGVGVVIGLIIGFGAGLVLAFWSCSKEIDSLEALVQKSKRDLSDLNEVIQSQDRQLGELEGYLVREGNRRTIVR